MRKRRLKMLERLLASLVKERDRESLLADFEEIHQSISQDKGEAAANVWYLKQILISIPPALGNRLYWFGINIQNYCILAFRKYSRQRTITLINISGLALGLAAFVVIELFISFETSFDTFHDNSQNIYRIQHNHYRGGTLRSASAMTSPAVPTAFKNNFDEVEKTAMATRVYLEYASFAYTDEVSFRADRIFIVTPSFLELFNFPLIKGDPGQSLSGPLKAVITQSVATQIFGDDDPLGKTLIYNKKHPFEITGICADVPSHSHIQFDVLLSFASLPYATPRNSRAFEAPESDWTSGSFYSYVRLRSGTDTAQLSARINRWLEQNRGEDWKNAGQNQEIHFQPLEDIHLNSRLANEIVPDSQGDGSSVRVLKLIAIFILGLAWVNYINLSTSRALERSREVGIRKVSGAYRKQLIQQLLFEYFGLVLMAVLLAVFVILSVMPYFSRLTQSALSFRFLLQNEGLSSLIWLLAGGTLLAGFYPAVLLSGFRPVSVIKGNLTRRISGVRLRKFLVTLQLAVSVVLIAGTLIVSRQISFLMHKDPGFAISHSLVVHAPGTNEPPPPVFSENFAAFRKEVLDNPHVLGLATTTAVPGEEVLWGSGFRRLEDDPQATQRINLVGIDSGFIPAFGIRLIAGRNFFSENPSEENFVILNESAARKLGLIDPEEAIKRVIYWRGGEMPVIGVIENYSQVSPKIVPIPLAFLMSPNRGYVSFKLNPDNQFQILSWLKKRWQAHFPGIPFDYFYLDDFFNRHYANDNRFGRVFVLFSGLTIVIACLGLFALASYNAVQRTKEIGIRKAVGASTRDIYLLLSREFLNLALVAGFIAVPFAYFQMQKWLENYAFRISLQWWMFAAAWAMVTLVVLATISFQSLRAARAAPVEALRYE